MYINSILLWNFSKYRKRIDKFFTLRDENNSQRNFEAIKEICDRG